MRFLRAAIMLPMIRFACHYVNASVIRRRASDYAAAADATFDAAPCYADVMLLPMPRFAVHIAHVIFADERTARAARST